MKPKKQPQPAPTVTEDAEFHLRALVTAIPKDEFWKPDLSASYRAAKKFLEKKGQRQ
jgi:hypothetical protein